MGNRQLKDLEDQLLTAFTQLEHGKIDITTCLDIWGPEDIDVGRALCATSYPEFHNRWQATAGPVNKAYLSLRNLCSTNYAPALSSTAPRTAKRSIMADSTTSLMSSSTILAATAIGFATRQNQTIEEDDQQDIHQLEEPQAWSTMSLDFHNLTPQVFFNTLTSIAAQNLAAAARTAADVTQYAEYYSGKPTANPRAERKHREDMIWSIRRRQPQPLSRQDVEDAMYNQLCGVQVTADRTREQMTRARCEELTLVETVTCIIPEPLDLENTDLPHPDLENAFISPQGTDYLVHLWVFNSNPYHVTQPTHQQNSQEQYRIINRGRKIATRGRILVTFGPTNQVLADKLTIHTRDGRDTGDIKISCYQDGATTITTGFIDLHNEEHLTVGWNCELIGEEIWVPAVAKELLNSRLGDTAAKRRRGARQFSLIANNSHGRRITGVTSNDRISKFNRMMNSVKNPATAPSKAETTSTLLMAAITTGGLAAIGALIYLGNRIQKYQQLHRENHNKSA